MTRVTLKPPAIGEIIFDIGYLIFAMFAGISMVIRGGNNQVLFLFGVLALILGIGDAFHLLPRIYSLSTGRMEQNYKALNYGKMVTSITMTIFYVILYYIWMMYYQINLSQGVTAVVLILAAVRIILCLCPQNAWSSKEPSYRFAIYRNIPFVVLGIIVASIYGFTGINGHGGHFKFMSLAIILSFIFYLIVVLFAGKNKMLGMFMLPKTCMYIWIISMGFYL